MIKKCGRCHNQFECLADKIDHCACTRLELSEECTRFLKKTHYDCLCISCLSELNFLTVLAAHYSFPELSDKMINHIHYYLENERMVFTEFYHILRGACCQNNCRHCAYGYHAGLDEDVE